MKKITEPELLLDVYDDNGNKTTFDISYHEINQVVKSMQADTVVYLLVLNDKRKFVIDETLYKLIQNLIDNEPPEYMRK